MRNLLEIEMLIHFRCSPYRFPSPSYGSSAYLDAITRMQREGLIQSAEPVSNDPKFNRQWKLTARGDVLLDAIKKTPLPVRKVAPEWVIPDEH